MGLRLGRRDFLEYIFTVYRFACKRSDNQKHIYRLWHRFNKIAFNRCLRCKYLETFPTRNTQQPTNNATKVCK